MKRIVRLTESDLARIVRRVIKEQKLPTDPNFVGKTYRFDGKKMCKIEKALKLPNSGGLLLLSNSVDNTGGCRKSNGKLDGEPGYVYFNPDSSSIMTMFNWDSSKNNWAQLDDDDFDDPSVNLGRISFVNTESYRRRNNIYEDTQSFEVTELTDLNKGTNATLTDGRGTSILSNYKIKGENAIGIFGKRGINMELGEQITASITLDPVWLVDGTVISNTYDPTFSFDSSSKTVTLKFNIPDQETFNKSDYMPGVVLKCKNIPGGQLRIYVGLPETTVVSESYRRRYYRY